MSEEGVLLPETDTGLADMCKLQPTAFEEDTGSSTEVDSVSPATD